MNMLREGRRIDVQCELVYIPSHKFPEKNLRVVILAKDEHVNEEGEITMVDALGEKDEMEGAFEGECQRMELSLCSAVVQATISFPLIW